jgi:hypothetical protein
MDDKGKNPSLELYPREKVTNGTYLLLVVVM